jgi:hypothetical protein
MTQLWRHGARAADAVVRLRLVVPGIVYLLYVAHTPQDYGDLGYMLAGAHLMFGGHGTSSGLQMYARAPGFQIGPLSFLLVRLMLIVSPFHPRGAMVAAGLLTLVPTLALAERWARTERSDPTQVRTIRLALLTGGSVLALGWADMMGGWAHLDDALTLLLIVAALVQLRHHHYRTAAVMLGLAVAAKPIALFALPALMMVPSWRGRLRSAGIAVGVGSLAFLPFEIANSSTLAAMAGLRIGVQAGSPLRVFLRVGVAAPRWERPVQMLVAVALCWACVRMRRPEGLLLAAMVARQILDAGDFGYYTAALMLGVLLVELERSVHGRAWSALGIRVLLPWVALNWDPFIWPSRPYLVRAGLLVLLAVWAGAPCDRWGAALRTWLARLRPVGSGRPLAMGAGR